MSTQEHAPNALIHETSPYLLQHAYNPVQWLPWGEAALQRAQKEDKPILVSIGYSACHWCHVMERESFENEEIAAIMNRDFVCIKVDREERPDVDQIYMDAIQAMGIQGGWPLNVLLTPQAKPFYGGTYFRPQQFANLLLQVSKAFQSHRKDLEDSAKKFTEGLNRGELEQMGIQPDDSDAFNPEQLNGMAQLLSRKFDRQEGGMQGAPKFPMPAIYRFLLHYLGYAKQPVVMEQLQLTLQKMAMGGIYDQIGGGFARYSVDAQWFAPHFEKMLYDNAQLISLYSEAWKIDGNPLYQKVVHDTITFAKRELLTESGGFCSALDADSEGMEGRFYVWTYPELAETLGEATELIAEFYNCTQSGNWEDGYNILNTTQSPQQFAQQKGLAADDFAQTLEKAQQKLFGAREKRERPGLDDKVLTSWNGLMLKGLADAYLAFGQQQYLELALDTAQFLTQKMRHPNGGLYRSFKNGEAKLLGYLEDYAAVIEGLTALYQATFNAKWLNVADELAEYVLAHFTDKDAALLFYTDEQAEQLIARKKEVFDNVIPASNSIMAENFYELGLLLDRENYLQKSEAMLRAVSPLFGSEVRYLSNWAALFAKMAQPTAEIAIVGKDSASMRKRFGRTFHPNKILCGTDTESDLPLLRNRKALDGQTTVYVCRNKTCQMPTSAFEKALEQLQNI